MSHRQFVAKKAEDVLQRAGASLSTRISDQCQPERHDELVEGVKRDIDASKPGPDILIARAIELKHHRREVANYLQALLPGNGR